MKRHILKGLYTAGVMFTSFVMLINPMAVMAADGVPVQSKAYAGFYNEEAPLSIDMLGRYSAGIYNADGGVIEIVAYNEANQTAYAVNGYEQKLAVIPLAELAGVDKANPAKLNGISIDINDYLKNYKETEENTTKSVSDNSVSSNSVSVSGNDVIETVPFKASDITSVCVSPDNTKLAVAIQGDGTAANGCVALFTIDESEDTLADNPVIIEVGVQPDMVTFTPDGTKVLTANEGEPRDGYGENVIDPVGSLSVIDVASASVKTVTFDDTMREEWVSAGVIIKKGVPASEDFEPEYIAVSSDSRQAFIALQEANAIAVYNLDSMDNKITKVYSLGLKDFGKEGNSLDLDKGVNEYQQTYEGLYGIYMPDGIAAYEAGGKIYLLTANEGDSREWGEGDNAYLNEIKDKTSPSGKLSMDKKVTWFDVSDYDGLDSSKDYLFGGRSFSVYEINDSGMTQVYDSANEFETISATVLPEYFNCSNDNIELRDRSGKKGPEPESVVTGQIGDKTYAFTALERIGGIMVYDITDPSKAEFVNYINSRDFSADIAGDVAPEGLKFINASESPSGKAMLLAACEVSGTMVVYEMNEAAVTGSEVKPDPKPEVKPDPKPEVKPDPKPEVKPDSKPEVKPETKPETKPQAVKKVKSTKVSLDYKKLTLAKGKTFKLQATMKPSNTTDKLTFNSSKPKNVSIDKNGKIKALKAGTSATITVKTTSGKKATCKVTVPKKAVKSKSVKLNVSKVTLKVNKTKTLKVTMSPKKTTDNVTFKSSNSKVAIVSTRGVVKAVKKGHATITVKTTSGKKATCKITVK